MSIDNNAIVFVGLEPNEIEIALMELLGKGDEDVSIQDEVDSWAVTNGSKLCTLRTNDEVLLVGFEICDSGSYHYVRLEYEDLTKSLRLALREFVGLFHKLPNVYVIEIQG